MRIQCTWSAALFLLLPWILLAGPPAPKPTIAVLNLKNTSGISDGEAQIISDRLRIELFNTGMVQVMEREQMDVILKEQGFQQSGACSDEGCVVEMGQLLGVQSIITGTIGKLGNMFLVNCRSINIATAKIEQVVSVDIKGDIEDLVGELDAIAAKLTKGGAQEESSITVRGKPKKEDKDIEEPKKDVEAGPAACTERPIIEIPSFGNVLAFKVDSGTVEDICEAFQEELAEIYDIDEDEILVLTPDKIASLGGGCTSPVIRMSLESYSTKPSGSQFIGTAVAVISVFDSPAAAAPAFSIKIKESGDRHWGNQVPLKNAFEKIAETFAAELKHSDYFKQWRRKKR